MAVAHRGSSSIDAFSASASWASPIAAGVVAGDYLLECVWVTTAASPNSGMSGWNLLASRTYFYSSMRMHIYERTADGGSNDAPTIGFSSTRTGNAFIEAYSGQDGAAPIGSNFLITDPGDIPAVPNVHAGLTSIAADSMLVGFGTSGVSKTGSLQVDNSATLGAHQPNGGASLPSTYSFYKSVGSGATGDTTVSNTNSAQHPQRPAWFTGIIAPAAGGGDPVLSNPTAVATGETTASGTVDTDNSDGVIWAYASTNSTEDESTITGSGDPSFVSGTGTQNINFTGLTAETTYYAHYVQETDSATSNVVSSASFTTAGGFQAAWARNSNVVIH